jgi:hypothetical protein
MKGEPEGKSGSEGGADYRGKAVEPAGRRTCLLAAYDRGLGSGGISRDPRAT